MLFKNILLACCKAILGFFQKEQQHVFPISAGKISQKMEVDAPSPEKLFMAE